MHFGRFCRETGRWIKVEADQASPVLAPADAAGVVPAADAAPPSAVPADSFIVEQAEPIRNVG